MDPQTNVANTKDWREACRGIRIRAYIESYMPTLSIQERSSPVEDFYDALRKISVPLPTERAATTADELDMEFQAWDALSDEALVNLEQELG